MNKKIVAIGGGKIGRKNNEGVFNPYETKNIDKRIVELTEKVNPNFLFLAHSISIDRQQDYFEAISKIYGDKLKCNCKTLKSDELSNERKVEDLINWADIIYEGGGSTLNMMKLWEKYSFDKKLYNAWNFGKVMCGLSAGANAWFELCNSDSLKIENGKDSPWCTVKCLGFLPFMLTPHCDEEGRDESTKEQLKENKKVGISLSNCCAIEIIDKEYKIIVDNGEFHNIIPYAKMTYWKGDKYIEKNLINTNNYESWENLINDSLLRNLRENKLYI